MNHRKIHLYALALTVGILTAALAVLHIILPDRTISEKENRSLQTFPTATPETVTDGRWEGALSDYVSDQMPIRDTWIRIKTFSERLIGKSEQNGTFLGKDGTLIERFVAPDESVYQNNLSALSAFAKDKKIPVRFLLAPTACSIYADKLPSLADPDDQNAYIDRFYADIKKAGITPIDVRPAFKKSDALLYYRTDHHWTSDAAYLAFSEYAEAANIKTGKAPEKLLISDTFYGTLSAATGERGKPDEIYAWRDKNTAVSVFNDESGEKKEILFDTDKLATNDQYAVFLGGNYPKLTISTSAANGKRLLLIKDSYANCMVPLLAPYYEKIVPVDPRYYYEDLSSLILSGKFTDILFLYNADTFASDTAMASVVKNEK